MPVEFLQNSVVGQQRQQISKLQFDKFLVPRSLWVWNTQFKNQATTLLLIFLSEAMLRIREVEMVDSLEELKSTRSVSGKNLPNFERRIPNSRGSLSRNREPRKRSGFYEEHKSFS